jgi:membrane protease YdiL (CAAX protease family)
MSAAFYFALNQSLVLASIVSIVMWLKLLAGQQWQLGTLRDKLIPVRRRRRPFWTLADALIMFGIHLTLLVLLHRWMTSQGWLPAADQAPELATAANPLANVALMVGAGLGSCLAILLWLRLIDGDSIRRLGLLPNRSDVWLGLRASLLLLPPVLMISAAVSLLWPYEHQVLDLLQSVESISVFAAMFLATAIVTPIFEELLFRVLIQGGFQAMVDPHSEDPDSWQPQSWWPIGVASLVFALMHLGQGAAPIPLFVLSLGLGYLYRQTGNITAPVVVHMVLNGLTLIVKFNEPSSLG